MTSFLIPYREYMSTLLGSGEEPLVKGEEKPWFEYYLVVGRSAGGGTGFMVDFTYPGRDHRRRIAGGDPPQRWFKIHDDVNCRELHDFLASEDGQYLSDLAWRLPGYADEIRLFESHLASLDRTGRYYDDAEENTHVSVAQRKSPHV